MADILQTGIAWLASQREDHLASTATVVYRRGQDDVTITPTLGRKLLKLSDDYGGTRMEWSDKDFIITASELVIDSETILPERGDQIRVTAGGTTTVYEVNAPGEEPVYQLIRGVQLRIHTKLYHTEDA